MSKTKSNANARQARWRLAIVTAAILLPLVANNLRQERSRRAKRKPFKKAKTTF